MALKLTPKQERIFRFVQSHRERTQHAPSLREIGTHFGIAPGTVQDQLIAIEKKGFIKRNEFTARGLQLTHNLSQLPLLGRVHAGDLHPAFENVEGYVAAEPRHKVAEHFALKISGDSMIDAGIFNGDIAIVRKQSLAQPGDIVVAQIEDETTVKFFRQSGRTVWLEPANKNYEAIRSPLMKILGKVIEVRHRYE